MIPDVPEIEPPIFDQPSDEPASALFETVNAAEPEGVRRQTRATRKRLKSSMEFWQDVFSTAEGRREAWKLLEENYTFDNPGGVASNGSYDPAVTAFLQGQKASGIRMFRRWIAYDREGVMLMLAEHPLPEVADIPKKRTRKTPT